MILACSVLELPERAVSGDWGRSILSRRPVLEDLGVYWPATFELVLFAMLIAVVLGVPLGILAAVRADRPADQVSGSSRSSA